MCNCNPETKQTVPTSYQILLQDAQLSSLMKYK